MKKQGWLLSSKLIIVLYFLLSFKCYAQKRDNIWMLGSYFGNNYGIDFSLGNADTFSLIRNMPFTFVNASICDTIGQLLFYTNGIYIENKNHDTLLDSPGFNPGFATNYYYNNGLAIYQGSLILPEFSNKVKYYIIHESGENIPVDSQVVAHPLNLAFSIVDMDLDNGLGGIVPLFKDVHLIDDTLTLGRLSAVKHANGRDWWIICHRYFSTTFYKFLLTPNGISLHDTQDIGDTNSLNSYFGFAVFSEDGSKFSFQINDTTLDLYDFDRCTGTLTNPVSLNVKYRNFSIVGSAFSPNGRFLYACNNYYLHQFDTWNSNIQSSDQTIAQWDSFASPLKTYFAVMRLAPDHRIYMGTYYGSNILHYIQFPDSAGVACNFVQNTFVTPSYSTFSFPNSPNYELGKINGSVCDSLSIGITEIPFQQNILIYPDPVMNELRILNSKNRIYEINITDILGKKIYSFKNTNNVIDVSFLKSGVYLLEIKTDDSVFVKKFVKE